MIVSWREATSQNTAHTQTNTFLTGKQTHTHSLTLSRTLTYEHHYHASPGISILSFPSSVNRTCPIQILHSTPTLLSTEHLSANTINGISENSRTCQIIESDIEQLLRKKSFFFTPLFKIPHAPCSMSTRRRSGVTFSCGLYIEINMEGIFFPISSNDQFTTSVHLLYS